MGFANDIFANDWQNGCGVGILNVEGTGRAATLDERENYALMSRATTNLRAFLLVPASVSGTPD